MNGSDFRGFAVQARDPADDSIGTFIVHDLATQGLVECSSAGLPPGVSLY